MGAATLLVGAALILGSALAGNKTYGKKSCPCMHRPYNFSQTVCVEDSKCFTDPTRVKNEENFTMCVTDAGDSECFQFPQHYGRTCGAHDASTPQCAGSDAGYCGEDWCYVDEAACETGLVEYAKSTYIQGLWFSYETCGGEADAWDEERIASKLQGFTLRAHIPELVQPFSYVMDPATGAPMDADDVDGYYTNEELANLEGVFVDLLREVCARAGCEVEFYATSSSSASSYGAYDGCQMDVFYGRAEDEITAVSTSRRRCSPRSDPRRGGTSPRAPRARSASVRELR